jgi:pimeloyl-ACP methyl ester carboxylesterase
MSSTGTGKSSWREEYPFESHFEEISRGVRIHYVDEGPTLESGRGGSRDLPTILCVHGNPTWSFYYRTIVAQMSQQCRVIAIDHIGCGLSDKPNDYDYCLAQHTSNLIQLIDALDLKNITLVVHDWGGAIGLGAAVARVSRFRNILILNTAAFPPPYIPKRIAACRIPVLGSWMIRYGNAFARAAIFMAIHRLPKLSRDARDGLLAPYDSPKNRIAIDRFVQDIPMTPNHRTWQVLESLEQNLPTLNSLAVRFVWGMQDWCFVPKCMERLQTALPDATRLELQDVGHYVMEEASAEVMIELKKLMDSHHEPKK